MLNKLVITNLHELDEEIILNTDLVDIVSLLSVNSYIKNVVINLLPNIVTKYNISDEDLIYEELQLFNFAHSLLDIQEFDILRKLFIVYDTIIGTTDELYMILGEGIINEDLYRYNKKLIADYFNVAPINYNWNNLIKTYLNHYEGLTDDGKRELLCEDG